MNIDDYMFMHDIPSLDLHGYDRDSARVEIDDFIRDSIVQGHEFVEIIHGIGTGIIRQTTNMVLSKNKNVIAYKSSYFNQGSTIVQIKVK